MKPNVTIRQMQEQDAERIFSTFGRWHKGLEKYQRYFVEQQEDKRFVLVAFDDSSVVAYVTIVWNSDYEPFRQQGIPEIVDLNVIDEYQRQGIGTRLICAAEQIVAQRAYPQIGIAVEQSSEYLAANKLYPKLGYVPDGNEITPEDNELHLIKQL